MSAARGFAPAVRRWIARSLAFPRAAWRRVFLHRNAVFIHSRVVNMGVAVPGLAIERYDLLPGPSSSVGHELTAAFGSRSVDADRWEMQRGAILWLARLDGQVCGASVSRRGRYFRCWFVPLHPDDVVIFRNRTLPEFRGRGICPALMRHIIGTELRDAGGRAYVDCRIYNAASIRSIEKAGFRRIATMRPLTRREALGV